MASAAVRNLIREGKAHQITSIIQTSAHIGMITMDQNLRDHYIAGKISYDDAITRAINQEELKRMISDNATKSGGAPARPGGPGSPRPGSPMR